jgi:putative oxidoreductase
MRERLVIYWTVKLVVAGSFLYAGLLKAWQPGQLQIDIERYRIVPAWLAWVAAAWLPYLEILAATALLHRRSAAGGRLLLAGLLVVFVAALISAWVRGLNVHCGCFGGGPDLQPNYPWWVGRDLLLLGALWILHRGEQGDR